MTCTYVNRTCRLRNNSIYILKKVSKLVHWLSDLINLSRRLAIWRLGKMKLNCSQQNLFLRATPLFPHGVNIVCLLLCFDSVFTPALLRTHSFVIHTMPIGKVSIYQLLFVLCVCVCVCVCTVTDFSGEDKASGVKFCTVHGSSASWAENLPFLGTLLPQKPKIGQIGA